MNLSLKKTIYIFAIIIAIISPAYGQGSIFGEITNSDFTNPDIGQIKFIGFLNNTDNEIRVESCDGAGYDNDHWYDDFQNYLGEAPEMPYRYLFYNSTNNEGYILDDFIANNSFQQENILLTNVILPEQPLNLSGLAEVTNSVKLNWLGNSSNSYHIYRRLSVSNGSFFRIDDVTGSLSELGIIDTFYIDNTVDGISSYDYLVVARNESSVFSPHSSIISISSVINEICGDVNGNGAGPDIIDLTFLIEYMFHAGPEPPNMNLADTNGSGDIGISDLTIIIEYMFQSGLIPSGCL